MKQDRAQVILSTILDHRDTKLVSILASPGLLHTQQPRFYVLYGNHKHRSVIQNDIAVMNVDIPFIHCEEDEWDCNVKLNSALLALRHRGGGPVHINLTTTYSRDLV